MLYRCRNATISKTNKNIGIDLRIADFAIFSNGTKIENPRFYEKSEKKLAKLQRELSRKTIDGSNWDKARIKAANLHKHISNQRNDFLHKLTTDIVQNYDVICIKDLDVKSMRETDNKTRNKRVGDVSFMNFVDKLHISPNGTVNNYLLLADITHLHKYAIYVKIVMVRNQRMLEYGYALIAEVN